VVVGVERTIREGGLMMYDGNGWGGGHWIAAIVMMVLFWGVLAVVVVALVRRGGWRHHGHDTPTGSRSSADEAERILHERFARGEIDEDEYRRRHDLLRERAR
jgi:putative membrane protein